MTVTVRKNARKLFLSSGHFEANLPRAVGSLCLILIALSLGMGATPQIPQVGPRNKSDAWVQHEINGVQYEVALEWIMGEERGPRSKRVLFVYLKPTDFNRDNLMLVVGNISSKIPQPTILNVTLLTDRDSLQRRVRNYSGWMVSHDTAYTRLTVESDTCCPQGFTGAQFDRYPDEGKFVICTNGKPFEISVDYKSRK